MAASALGRIAVFFADDAFEFAQAHAVGVGHFGLGINLVALFQGCPQAFVAHDDGVDHAIGVKGELVLAQHAELSRANDGALLGVEFAGKKLHEGGFSGPVGTGQAIALARRKGGRDVFEQNFGAVAHRYIAD